MDVQMLTTFFMWCTIINAALLVLTSSTFTLVPDWAYRMHSRFFSISRDAFNVAIYSFIGGWKILFMMFNLVPYVALLLAA